jgi:hypothetical protein
MERWKIVPGFDGWYEASDAGGVRSWRVRAVHGRRACSPRQLKTNINRQGYRHVKLTDVAGRKRVLAVHRLVLYAFLGKPPCGSVCDHINAIRSDNRLENLRWVTVGENVRHAVANGRMTGIPGARAQAKLNPGSVERMRMLRVAGATLAELGRLFGVAMSTAGRVCSRGAWRDV